MKAMILLFVVLLPVSMLMAKGGDAEFNRRLCDDSVMAFCCAREDRWLEEPLAVVNTGDSAAITAYTGMAQCMTLANAKRIFDELTWCLVRMNFKRGHYGNLKRIPERKLFMLLAN